MSLFPVHCTIGTFTQNNIIIYRFNYKYATHIKEEDKLFSYRSLKALYTIVRNIFGTIRGFLIFCLDGQQTTTAKQKLVILL